MNQQIPDALIFINDVLKEYLSPKSKFQGKKFTGTMNFKISCVDGGISSVEADVNKYLKHHKGGE